MKKRKSGTAAENNINNKTIDKLFQVAFEANPYPIVVTEIENSTIIVVNQGFCTVTGYNQKDVIGKTALETGLWVNPEDRNVFHATLMREGSLKNMKFDFRYKNGKTGAWLISASTFRLGEKDHVLSVVTDITDRKRAEERILKIAESVSLATGDKFFSTLVCRMSETLNAAYVFIAELPTPDARVARTIAVSLHGEEVENVDYILTGTPCENVMQSQDCLYPSRVQELFPDDQMLVEMGIEAYAGSPLLNTEGKVLGILVALFDREIINPHQMRSLLQIFAVRVADEMERIKTEIALRESEYQLRTVFQLIPDAVSITDMESGKFVEVNERWCRLTGYSREEALKMSSIEMWVNAGERKLLLKELEEKGEIENFEKHIRVKDGSIRTSSSSSKIILLGEKPHILAINRDITEAKKSEVALQESEERFRRISEATFEGIAFTYEGRIVDANQQLADMMGYTLSEIVGIETMELIAPESRDYVRRMMSIGSEEAYKHRALKKDGTILEMEVRGKEFVLKGKLGRVVAILDITEKKETREKLRESEEKYRYLVDNANDAVLVVQDEVVKFANPRTVELIGYSAEELAAINFLSLVHPEDRELVVARYLKRLKGEDVPTDYSFRVVTKTGVELWAMLNAALITWEGRPATLNMIRDITELKTLEEQAIQAQKLEAVGTLAGGIAHDFNNLLQAIQGYADLLLMRKNVDESETKELRGIAMSAMRGADLTRQLLTFSRKVESRRRPLDLNSEIKKVCKLLERTIPKMIELELELDEKISTVNADPSQLEQILMNLAINAKDAMPDGGSLKISTSSATLDENFCRANLGARTGEYAEVVVSDTGCGMDESTLAQIFNPFFTTKKVGRGTGLGLAMVYGIIKNHEGFITCRSTPDVGTTFTVYIPTAEPIEEPVEIKDTGLPGGGSETILIIDDEAVIREIGEEILSSFGYKVLTADNGEVGFETYIENRDSIDLVVLDLIMPGLGGKKCLEKLLDEDRDAKIIIASGFSDDDTVKEALAAGARGFMNKPFDLAQLLTLVRNILDEE